MTHDVVRFVKPPSVGGFGPPSNNGHCCPGQGVCQKSSRSLKPFGHNPPTLQTDRRTDFLWHRPDLTVGQKLYTSLICLITCILGIMLLVLLTLNFSSSSSNKVMIDDPSVNGDPIRSIFSIFHNECSQCKQLEGHSVERIYLRQRSSDGSVNKIILKPRLALAARRQ